MTDTQKIAEQLQKSVGFKADALYVFGGAPFQPADRELTLTAVAQQGDELELTLTFTMGASGDYLVRVQGASGLKVSKDRIVIQEARSVVYGGQRSTPVDGGKSIEIARQSGKVERVASSGEPALQLD